MGTPLPYYMTYETPLYLNDDRRNRIDYDYMKSMYPDTARRLLPYIEEECDRMGYQGSILFDEFPDKLQIRLMCSRIAGRARVTEKIPHRWLKEMIEVMTCHELQRRRAERRNCRRFY